MEKNFRHKVDGSHLQNNEGYASDMVWPVRMETARPSAGMEFKDPHGMENPQYSSLLRNYFKCVTYFLNDHTEPAILEKQLGRRDLDTVCAYELYQMKKAFTTTNVLDFSEFLNKK